MNKVTVYKVRLYISRRAASLKKSKSNRLITSQSGVRFVMSPQRKRIGFTRSATYRRRIAENG